MTATNRGNTHSGLDLKIADFIMPYVIILKYEFFYIFAPSIGVPCLRNQTQKQAENIPIDGVETKSYK
jgi:hypothetical protein